MRKLIVFLVFMNLLLFGGGQYLNAGTPQNFHQHTLEKKHRVKFTNQDQGSSIIEDAGCLLYTSDAADDQINVVVWGGGGG